MGLDRTDRRILEALMADGRATAAEIADRIDSVGSTVSRRQSSLEAAGIIGGYVPAVAYEEFGYNLTVVITLGVGGDSLPEIRELLSDHDRLGDVYEVTGGHDVVAVGKFRDTTEMTDEIGQLFTHPDARAFDVNVVREIVREHSHGPLPDEAP